MSIPTTIHYFWASTVPIPEKFQNYIDGWQKLNPDYKVRRWTEKDLDFDKYPLVKKALAEKRWALVADMVRMYAIYNEGGFYCDTDIELLKPLDELTKYDAVAGWESNFWFTTAFFGAKKHSPWVEKLLRRFEMADANEKITTNTFLKTVHAPSVYAKDFWPLQLDGKTRVYGKDEFAVFSREYFSPKHYMTGKDCRTKNTIAYHHYASTWHTRVEAFKNFMSRAGYRIFGPKIFATFERRFNRKLERQIRKEQP